MNENGDDFTKCQHYSIDPFPEVEPSLLNSVDIVRYAREGCLVHPFSEEKGLLNPATYTIRFLGTLHSWELIGETLCYRQSTVKEKRRVTLRPNSISYLETEEQFRLPQYIAARFNLHIRHVHRGILLGTGPMVDPGFVGPLLIPLHNLTANPYPIDGGDKFLWVEFTKLTRNRYWIRSPDEIDRIPPKDLVVFPNKKMRLTAKEYFAKAGVEVGGVVSAFKGELAGLERKAEASTTAAQTAQREATAASTYTKRLTIGAGAGLLIALSALLLAAYELYQNNTEMAVGIQNHLHEIDQRLESLSEQDG